MSSTSAEVLTAAQRSAEATGAHDRAGWVGLFTADGRVEDPYGSRPHVGHTQIGRFYDTFISPRQIIFHPDLDVVAGTTVVRDVLLEVVMAAGCTLNVPAHLRYDLRASDGGWAIERLRAHWELPVMIVQMLRQGTKSIPASIRLAAGLLRNQRLSGAAGFLSGFRRADKREKRCVEAFLDAAVAGDQLAARRALSNDAVIGLGEATGATAGELVDRLRGGRWTKSIASGDTVSASVHTPSGRGVIFSEIGSVPTGITRIQYFGSP
ncbi:MAG: ketosteroid isomerase family protein [Mycobacterium sp.]